MFGGASLQKLRAPGPSRLSLSQAVAATWVLLVLTATFLAPSLRASERFGTRGGRLRLVWCWYLKWLVITLNNGVMDLFLKGHGDSRSPSSALLPFLFWGMVPY